MHRFFIPKPFKQEMQITGRDAHHIMDVLRMVPGDQLQAVADDGISFVGEITATGTNTVNVIARGILRESHEPDVRISLLQGLAKGEKMELIIQKAVEIGVVDIFPLAMNHSVVVLDRSKAGKKTERWQKIAEAAAKQSKRDVIPDVHEVMTLGQVLQKERWDLLLVAYESENRISLKEVLQAHKNAKSIGVIIGPEGGLSNEEVKAAQEAGGIAVSLGRRILRTETAGLVAAAAILYETDNLGI
ncbi:MAG: 16S rRNA (uracil(1498)-N(3))-methyltransferase [Acidaminococcaceae bacterium]|nr:16S rRNA (uracil(1498)-N(3))-methyltransferase [Acidaminococcaceae bacterium]